MKKLNRCLFGSSLVFVLAINSFVFAGGENVSKRERRAQQPLKITVVPWGPTQEMVDAAKLRVERSDAAQKLLQGTKYRIMGFEYIDNAADKSQPTTPPTRFRVVFYDYTNDRTLVAESDFAGTENVAVREESFQPNPNDEEFNEATRIIESDARFTSLLRNQRLRAFQPMPPITVLSGTTERLVNIGLESQSGATKNEVVSVSIKRGVVIRYDSGAPETSLAAPESCGIPSAGQASTGNGTAGQYQLTVSQDRSVLWEMLVIRPSASSGNLSERSGIEVRDVKYKGKSVLKRGHAPVLNVQYIPRPGETACGPYRDWQYQEGAFNAPAEGATDPAPGVRILAPGQVASTALDSGSDTGNFNGVAIYQQDVGFGMETVLVLEMNAGWYRYIMEWRFAPDGTIRPRYGFGATNNSCVCYRHNHHVYWRFDFDIVTPTNKIFQIERGRKFMRPITTEAAIFRNYQTNRGFMIQNSTSDEAYEIVPNISDGQAYFTYPETGNVSTYGAGDFWLLKYQGTADSPSELDDPNSNTEINLAPWINGESLVDQDIVVWYGAHFVHADGADLLNPDRSGNILNNSHVVGPDLRPVRW
ncbi:MAG: hypothetical protein ACR2HG_00305 [Pyrinomonadaceae bacterium]